MAQLPEDMVQPNAQQELQRSYAQHVREGHHAGTASGWLEQDEVWSHRACDMLLAIKPAINIVAGVIARDGTAFHQGNDVLANLVVYGVNPIHVDAIVAVLMGHNPERIGYLRIAKDRGLGEHNPKRIPVFEMSPQGEARVCRDVLETFGCLHLGVIHHGRGEPIFL